MDLDSLFNTKVTTASKFSEKLSDAAGVVIGRNSGRDAKIRGYYAVEVLERVCRAKRQQQLSWATAA
jgi:hypothetical protein